MLRSKTTVSLFTLLLVMGCSSGDSPNDGADADTDAYENAEGSAQIEDVEYYDAEEEDEGEWVSEFQFMRQLEKAGLSVEDLGAPKISPEHQARFPEDPLAIRFVRVGDGQGNSTPMTLVQFEHSRSAAELDEQPVNGFAVANWFVLGMISTYFVGEITEAVEG